MLSSTCLVLHCFWKEVCLSSVLCSFSLAAFNIFHCVSGLFMLSVLFLGLFLLIHFSPHPGLYFLASLSTLWFFGGCQTFEFYFVGGCFFFFFLDVWSYLFVTLRTSHFGLDSEVEAPREDCSLSWQYVPAIFLWLPSIKSLVFCRLFLIFLEYTVSSEQYACVCVAEHGGSNKMLNLGCLGPR